MTPRHKQYLRLIAKPGSTAAAAKANEVAVNRVVVANTTGQRFYHSLATATVGIAVSSNWNANIYIPTLTSSYFDLAFSGPPPRGGTVSYRLTTNGGYLSVAADDETATLTHNLNDATVAYFVAPSWNTNVYISSKTADTIVYGFGVTPTEAGQLYYGRFNLSSSAILAADAVTADAERHTLTHNLNYPWVDLFYVPTWNTGIYVLDSTRADNALSVGFNTPAPSGSTLDAVAGVPT